MVYASWKKWISLGAVAGVAFLPGCMNRAATYREGGGMAVSVSERDAFYRNRGMLPPGIYEEPGLGQQDMRGIGGASSVYQGVKVGDTDNQRFSNSVDVLQQWSKINSWDSITRTNLPAVLSATPSGGSDGINGGTGRPGEPGGH